MELLFCVLLLLVFFLFMFTVGFLITVPNRDLHLYVLVQVVFLWQCYAYRIVADLKCFCGPSPDALC